MKRSLKNMARMLALALLLANSLPVAAQLAIQPQDDDEVAGDYINVFLPAPRELRYHLQRAEDATAQQRFTEVVESLGAILNPQGEAAAEYEEDYFVESPGQTGTLTSIKAQARKLLDQLPPKGRELYEIHDGPFARAMLQDAIASGDMNQLNEITRRFFHTKAGYESALLLGRHHLDQGRPLAAAMCFKRVVESQSAGDYEPEASVMLAICWLQAGMADNAEAVLADLKDRMPFARLVVQGKELRLFEETGDTLVWLAELAGASQADSGATTNRWGMHRGDPTRNARCDGGMPLDSLRWFVRVRNIEEEQEIIRSLQKQYVDRKLPALPALQPLAVGEWVVMRTVDGTLGINFETGRRIWVWPLQTVDADKKSNSTSVLMSQFNQRIWEDSAHGQMSSDGKTVFLLDTLGYATRSSYGRVRIGPGGVGNVNRDWPTDYNELVALALRDERGHGVEGKLKWMVGGKHGYEEPELAGVFFLGAPLPMLGRLYALVEVNTEIRLVVLDAKTGRLQWMQQLAMVDHKPILEDTTRRLAGASPSFADGVLVCPTSAGAVVAVDLSTRSLLWGFRYGGVEGEINRFGFSSSRSNEQRPVGERWSDATATISGGHVILTPVESDEMYCLDLFTGKSLWPEKERGDMLYVGCVHDDTVVMVAKSRVYGLSLDDGSERWETALGDTAMPSGRGVYSDRFFYLPTTDSELLKIDLTNGKVVEKAATDSVLGNLICYQGDILSQSPTRLSAFRMIEPLRERVSAILRENPDDVWALTRKGELLLHDSQQRQALEAVRRAHELDPSNDEARAVLVKVMLAALRSDYAANQHLILDIGNLIDHPDQRSEYLRIRALGLQEIGKSEQAFEAFLSLVAGSTDPTDHGGWSTAYEKVDRKVNIRRDRWIRNRLSTLLAVADPDQRRQMDATIATRFETALKTNTMESLSDFLRYFDVHPLADRARLELAARQIDQGELLEAEMLLVPLQSSPQPQTAAKATALLARLLDQAGRLSEAAACYRELANKWSDIVCLDGKTGSEVFASIDDNSRVGKFLQSQHRWATGRAEVTSGGEVVGNSPSYLRVYPVAIAQRRGPTLPNIAVCYDQRSNQLIVFNGRGDDLLRVSLSRQDGTRYYSSNYAANYCRIFGHLLIVSHGYELIAIDLLEAEQNPKGAILWRTELVQTEPPDEHSFRTSRNAQSKTISIPFGANRYRTVDENQRLVGITGSLSDNGLCYLRQGELVCVDPLTGEAIWSRNGFEPGCDAFGDDEFLFVIPPGKQQAMVFDAADGSLVDQRNLEDHFNRWTTVGRRVLSWQSQGEGLRLSLYDAWDEVTVWEQSFPQGTCGCLAGHDRLAVLEPSGKWMLVSLDNGETLLKADLEPEAKLHSVHVLSDGERMFVATTKSGSTANIQPAPSGFQTPLIDGRLYALDPESGERLWQVPAVIDKFGWPPEQPADLPVLIFLRHKVPSSSRGPSRTQSSILLVDKRDGRMLFQQDDIPSYTHSYHVEGDVENQLVTIQLPGKNFAIRYTDEPLPPAPPVQMGAASSLFDAPDESPQDELDLSEFGDLKDLFNSSDDSDER